MLALEHGRNEPNITRLYDAKRGICRHSQQQIACLPVMPIGKQAQIRNVVGCHLSVGRCEYAFRSTPASGSPARCAPLLKPRISACWTFNSPKPTAVRSSCRCSSVNCLSSLPPKSALARCRLRRSRPCADARHRQTVNEWPVPTGHLVQRPVQRACNGSNKFVSNCERPDA